MNERQRVKRIYFLFRNIANKKIGRIKDCIKNNTFKDSLSLESYFMHSHSVISIIEEINLELLYRNLKYKVDIDDDAMGDMTLANCDDINKNKKTFMIKAEKIAYWLDAMIIKKTYDDNDNDDDDDFPLNQL